MQSNKIEIFNYQIFNKEEGKTIDVHIDGDIVDAGTQQMLKDWFGDETSVSYKSLRNQIEDSKAKTVNIYINSPGGHVGDAMAIHDYLQELESKGTVVNRRGRGIVGSASTYILMGKNSELSKNSFFFIHNTRGGIYGTLHEVGNYYRTMEKFNNRIRDFYSEFTGKPKETISTWMDREELMTADVAKERGFVNTVTGEVELEPIPENKWPLDNTSILNKYNSQIKKPFDMSNIKDQIKSAFEEVLGKLGIGNKKDDPTVVEAFDAFSSNIESAIKQNGASMTNEQVTEIVNNILTDKKFLTEESVKNLLTKEDIKNLATIETVNKAVKDEVSAMKNEVIDGIAAKLGTPTPPSTKKEETRNTRKDRNVNNKYSEYAEDTEFWQVKDDIR